MADWQLVALTVLSLVSSIQGSCPTQDWKFYKGSCLWFSMNKLSHKNASIDCEQRGGAHIVKIEGDEIDSLLSQNLTGDAWIDVRQASRLNWFPGAPTYGSCIAKYHEPNSLSHNHGTWYSARCDSKRRYICQTTQDYLINECPSTAKWVQGKCLWALNGKRSFFNGSESCKQLGGSIVQIDSSQKQDAVRNILTSDTWIEIPPSFTASGNSWLNGKPADPECFATHRKPGTIFHGTWFPLGCHYFRTVLCEKRPDPVQRIASTTTRDGIILAYRKYPKFNAPPSAKCPQTMRGYEVCKKHANYEDCKLYCQPKKHSKSLFEMEILQQTRHFDTMKYIGHNIWAFAYIYTQSPPRAADFNMCIRGRNGTHNHLLSSADFRTSTNPNLQAFVGQFQNTQFNLYQNNQSDIGYMARGTPNVLLPTAILCFDRCESYDAESEIAEVDEYGYYHCKGTKVPIVPYARAACRGKVWYGDCIDRPIGTYVNVSIIWSSGYYTCNYGLVPTDVSCIASPQTIDFHTSCLTPREFVFRNKGQESDGCTPPAIASLKSD